VTLNLTVITPTVIYQSADFRLTDLSTGLPTNHRSPKLVTFVYEAWIGFVTYTGLGDWQGKDISDHVADWLTGYKELSMEQVAHRLQRQIAQIIRSLSKGNRPLRRHTFTLAGIRNSQMPEIIMVSNSQDCFRKSWNTQEQFTISRRSLREGERSLVVVTGRTQAVPPGERGQLREIAARYPGDGGRVRRMMVDINNRAASSPQSQGLIGPDCAVFSFRADGAGAYQLGQDTQDAPWQFPQMSFGSNMTEGFVKAMRSLGIDPESTQFSLLGSASSGRADPASLGLPKCQPSIAEPDAQSRYSVTEIVSEDFEPHGCNDISNGGYVVGTGRLRLGQALAVPWRWANGQIVRLNYSGLALAVNDTGQVAGALQDGGVERAGLYSNDFFNEFPIYHGQPEIFAGSDTYGYDLNHRPLVIGQVRSRAEEKGRANVRPTAFQIDDDRPHIFMPDGYNGLPARGINDQDDALVYITTGPRSGNAVWNITGGSLDFIDDDGFQRVSLRAITNYGIILGQATTAKNIPFAIIRMPGGPWRNLGTGEGWIPLDINDHGDVVGSVGIEELTRPWLRLASGETVLLPFIREHHTTAMAINNNKQIAGCSAADHGGHALLWSPKGSWWQ